MRVMSMVAGDRFGQNPHASRVGGDGSGRPLHAIPPECSDPVLVVGTCAKERIASRSDARTTFLFA